MFPALCIPTEMSLAAEHLSTLLKMSGDAATEECTCGKQPCEMFAGVLAAASRAHKLAHKLARARHNLLRASEALHRARMRFEYDYARTYAIHAQRGRQYRYALATVRARRLVVALLETSNAM